jgi:hypothetical protein
MTLKPNDINQILKGYIDAAIWTEEERLTDDYKSEYGYEEDNDNEDDELERLIKVSANLNKKPFESFTKEDIEPNSLIKAYTDIKKFLDLAGDSVIEAIEENGLEQLGHDIWLTRNGHGAGFFDRSYGDDNEKRLTQAAKALREVTIYINDNLRLSFDNEHIFENKSNEELINMAHSAITRKKGKDYAPDVHEIQAWIDTYLNKSEIDEAKKTDFSKEKSQGLHGWFSRRGGDGSSGWVDCNTCRKDPETGRKKCKPCGRQDGEKRKYPACRPTPSACGTKGKGKSWGKKSKRKNNENENKSEMKNLITEKLHEMVQEGHNEFQNYMFFNNLKTIKEAIDELLQMDAHAVDQLLSDGHNWALDHLATSADDIEEVYHFLNATLDSHEPDSYDGETEAGYEDEYGSVEDGMRMMNEAEYKGKKVKLGKPMRGDVKKYKVFVKNKKGKVVKVNFGDKKMEIKRDNPKRRKSFRARHKCSQAKDRTTPKYWSCRMWSKKPVSKIVGENFGFDENTSIFVRNENMTQPATKPLVPETKPKTTEPKQPVKPSRRDKPFLPEVTPGIVTDPKALDEGAWKDIMKGVRSGDIPFSVIAFEPTWDERGKKYKVVGQQNNIQIPDLIPAVYEHFKRTYPNAVIGIEDGGGQIVWTSKK